MLIERLSPPQDFTPLSLNHALRSPDSDYRHYARMRASYVKRYAQILPLTKEHLQIGGTSPSIDWLSVRAWFDEAVKATRRNNLFNGCWWTGAPFGDGHDPDESYVTDSYFAYDFELWGHRQQERDSSLTLATDSPEEVSVSKAFLEGLREVVLEQTSDSSVKWFK
jgi:hypothetical protein